MSDDGRIDADGLDAGIEEAFGTSTMGPSGPPSVLREMFDDAASTPRVFLRNSTSHGTTGDSKSNSEARYAIEGEIARGGMGIVLRGQDVDLGREVAVKVIRPEFADNAMALHRFIEEAQIAGQLQHPGVVPVYELGVQEDRRVFFSMKLIEGQTLAERLHARPDPAREHVRLVGIFEQICQTMAYAHSRGVVHRDLKPENVLLGAFGEVQVADWGFAKVLGTKRGDPAMPTLSTARDGTGAVLSQAGSVMGTPNYMPPEQAKGDLDDIDERADVFTLGGILLEVLTGEPPYAADGVNTIIHAAKGDLDAAFTRLDESAAHNELKALCRRCLAADKAKRPRDAGAVVEALTAHRLGVEDRAQQAVIRAAEAQVKASEETRRRRLTMALAGSVVAALLIALGGFLWVSSKEAERQRDGAEVVLAEIGEAERLAGAAGLEHIERWAEAEAAAERAVDLASLRPVDEGTRAHAARVAAALASRAELGRRNAAWVDRLEHVRTYRADERMLGAMHDGLAQVFEQLAIYPETNDVEKAAARIREAGIGTRLVEALDEWVWLRSMVDRDTEALVAIANAADPDTWRRELRTAGIAGDLEGLQVLALAPSLDGNGPVLLAQYLSRLGDHDTAVSVLQQAHRRRPDDLWINLGLGLELSLVTPPRHGEATAYLRVAVAKRPGLPSLRSRLGITLRRHRQLDQAIASLEDAVIAARALDTDALPFAEILIETHEDRGSLDAFIEHLEASIADAPDDVVVLGQLGRALLLKKDYDRSLELFRRVAQLEPHNPVHAAWTAYALLLSRQIDDASAAITSALASSPDHPQLNWIAAFIRTVQERREEALGFSEVALRGDPYRLDYVVTHTNTLMRVGRLDEAVAAFRRGLRIRPDFAELKSAEGKLLFAQGRVEDARRALMEATQMPVRRIGGRFTLRSLERPDPTSHKNVIIPMLHENDPVTAAWHFLGMLNSKLGHVTAARDAWMREYERSRPEDKWGKAANIAFTHLMLGDFEAAERFATICIDGVPETSKGFEAFPKYVRGWAYVALSKPELARADFYPSFAIQSGRSVDEMRDLVDDLVRLGTYLPDLTSKSYAFASPLEKLRASWVLLLGAARPAQAARLAEEAFAEQPELAFLGAVTPTQFAWGIWAGMYAVQASTGPGLDTETLTDEERVEFRRIALRRLTAGVADLWTRYEQEEPGFTAPSVGGELSQLLAESQYSGLRHPHRIDQLPEPDRTEWTAFWRDVNEKLVELKSE